jgi:hypothetical protein
VRRQTDAQGERSDYESIDQAPRQQPRTEGANEQGRSDYESIDQAQQRQRQNEAANEQRRPDYESIDQAPRSGDRTNQYFTDGEGNNRRDLPATNRSGDPENVTSQPPRDNYMTPPPNQQQRIASAEPQNGPAFGSDQWKAQRRLMIDVAVNRAIVNDADASRMRTDGLSPEEAQHTRRNIAELIEYTRQPAHQKERAELMARVEAGLRGPQTNRDGIVEYPLLARYVGEHLPGFDNWNTRPKHEFDLPGELYGQKSDFSNIVYKTAAERDNLRVFVDGKGRLAWGDGTQPRDGKFMFVVDRDGRMIVAPQIVGETHHSSLSGGAPVRMAGEITFDSQGRIKLITNISGHFRPDNAGFERFLADFRRQGVDLKGAKAPAYRFEVNERGQFYQVTVNDNLLREPKKLQGGPVSVVAPLKMPKAPKTNRRAEVVPFPGLRQLEMTYTVSEEVFGLAA